VIKALTAGLSTFGRNFLLAYNVRAGLALLLSLIRALRAGGPRAVFTLRALSAEPRGGTRAAATQLGLFVGVYSGAFRALFKLLQHFAAKRRAAAASAAEKSHDAAAAAAAATAAHDAGVQAAVAGAVASASIFFLPGETRHTLAL
jgi:hypothetical protein